jgi:predicted CXXCH cytochrome family protein
MLVLAASLALVIGPTLAQEGDGERSPLDQRCLGCHSGSTASTTFENGEQRSVAFDVTAFDGSVHGMDNPRHIGLSCYDCHGDYKFPHEGGPYATPRDFRLELNQRCEGCHSHQAELQADSTHSRAFAAGDTQAAVCVDCHGYHAVSEPGEPRQAISLTCGQCHTDIFEQYQDSVHGAALLEESNQDVPTCISCHGVHNIEDPTTNLFRLRSPTLCAQCHANDELMEQYDISTYVFESYVSDFHGTTVTLFAEQAPDAEVNKAVCYDCHGVHNIRSSDDPESSVVHENLLATCQRCHPDATASFAEAWTKHYEPDQEKFPLVYSVNLFYKFFIPGILGFFVIVLVPDAIRRILRRGDHHG